MPERAETGGMLTASREFVFGATGVVAEVTGGTCCKRLPFNHLSPLLRCNGLTAFPWDSRPQPSFQLRLARKLACGTF